jgi:hypothetical protein
MRSAPHWHQLSPARRERERERLAHTPYFTLEHTSTNGRFTAIGTLHFNRRFGKEYHFRIRLDYPRRYPKRLPHVFDHDHQFTPSLDGHLFSTHELCLTLPERGEFSTVSEQLTQELLGATLVWFHKRLLFDRTGVWPGPAEPHGINAVINLLVERHVTNDASAISDWLLKHARTPNGHVCPPDLHAPCPCESGKPVTFCHRDDLQLIGNRLAPFVNHYQLTAVLGIK